MYTYRKAGKRMHSFNKDNVPGAILAVGTQWRTQQVPAFVSLLEKTDLYKICYILHITYTTIMSGSDIG